jgi:hypothetical protein
MLPRMFEFAEQTHFVRNWLSDCWSLVASVGVSDPPDLEDSGITYGVATDHRVQALPTRSVSLLFRSPACAALGSAYCRR